MKQLTSSASLGVSANERALLVAALRTGLRPDTRALDELRPVRIAFGHDLGYVTVTLGKTRVIATVSAEITPPAPDTQGDKGVLLFTTEISPMAAPGAETGRLSEDEVVVSRMLDKILRRSEAVKLDGLCLVRGEQVWTVRVDVRVVDNDGNVMDCASIAALAAMLHFRLPAVTVEDGEVTVHDASEKPPTPLSVFHAPLCMTFAFFDQGAIQVIDPSLLEEAENDGTLTVASDVHRDCTVSMSGGAPLPPNRVLQCAKLATVKIAEVLKTLDKALTADLESRGISLHASNIFDRLEGDYEDELLMLKS
ncbi:3'-5'-exoribonuclease [Blastocladiella emersonii ATCC 22665]|nr:3'-5'-exoribonuclease [Blastocladiella emersonii ATCC 22665]